MTRLHAAILLFVMTAMPAADAPLVGRPREHFYGAVGEQVRLELRAAPTAVSVEDPLVLTLLISGADNPEKIERPDLRQLPEYDGRFFIDDLPDEGVVAGRRHFRYRLRPRSERVRDVPPLVFRYYNPRLDYFATTASPESIPLQVRPRQAPSAAGVPLAEPAFLYELPDESDLRARPWSESLRTVMAVVAVGVPPLVFLAWLMVWRWRYPSAAKLAALRRSRAVRAALDGLAAAGAGRAAVDQVALIVSAFLLERTGLPASATTPAEVAAGLEARAAPAGVVNAARAFFERCDAVRYGPAGGAADPLTGAARELILLVEESA